MEASHLLLAGQSENLQHALRVVGEALGARSLAVSVQEQAHERVEAEYFEWRPKASELNGTGHSAPSGTGDQDHVAGIGAGTDGSQRSLSFPITSTSGALYGSLDYVYVRHSDEEVAQQARTLSVLSNLLAGFLERRAVIRRLRASKERYQRLIQDHPMPVFVLVDGKITYANIAASELVAVPPEALIGRSYLDFVPATQFGDLEDSWRAVLGGEQLGPVRHEVIRQDGEERLVESQSLPFTYEGDEGVEVILRDITELHRSEERYRAFLETSSQAFWSFKLDRPLPADLSHEEQAEYVWHHARLTEWNAELERLVDRSGEDLAGSFLSELLGASGREVVEDFVRRGFSLKNKRYRVAWRRGAEVEEGEGTERHLIINAVSTGQRESPLSHIWGTCVEVTEQIEMERRMVRALEGQQEGFARDLHDGLGQYLTGMRMFSGNLIERHFSNPDDPGYSQARKIHDYARQATQSMRELYRGLAPRQLVDEGLVGALDELVTNIGDMGVVHAIFLHDGSFDVHQHEVKLQLYRIAQEATNNALKYADAEHLWVQLQRDDEYITLQIEDDGCGFDVSHASTQSLGLYSMRYRAHAVHGELDITTGPGEGTIIRCDVPLKQVRASEG